MSRFGWMVGVVALGLAGPVAGEPKEELKDKEHKLTKVEKDLVQKINAARAKHKKAELKSQPTLNTVAHAHAENMAAQQQLAHTLDEKSPLDRLDAAGYKYGWFAENVAGGYPTPARAVQGWLDSPGHKANMLDEEDRGYTELGVGTARGKNGWWYYCAVFAKPRPK